MVVPRQRQTRAGYGEVKSCEGSQSCSPLAVRTLPCSQVLCANQNCWFLVDDNSTSSSNTITSTPAPTPSAPAAPLYSPVQSHFPLSPRSHSAPRMAAAEHGQPAAAEHGTNIGIRSLTEGNLEEHNWAMSSSTRQGLSHRVQIHTIAGTCIVPGDLRADKDDFSVRASIQVGVVLGCPSWVRKWFPGDPMEAKPGGYVRVAKPDYLLTHSRGGEGHKMHDVHCIGCFGDVVTACYGEYRPDVPRSRSRGPSSEPKTPRTPSSSSG